MYRPLTACTATLLLVGVVACGPNEMPSPTFGFAGFGIQLEDGGFDPRHPEPGPFAALGTPPKKMHESKVHEPKIDKAIVALGPTVARYDILIFWGHRDLLSDPGGTNWSGTISTAPGILRVQKILHWDPFDVLLPSISSQSVELKSKTFGNFDGITLSLHVPLPVKSEANPVLSVQLGAATVPKFTLGQLRNLIFHKVIGSRGNTLSILAYRQGECPTGFLSTSWIPMKNNGGILFGQLWNADGSHGGQLFGLWGTKQHGLRRFFGLFMRHGLPPTALRGTYTRFPTSADGLLRSHWVDASGQHAGVIDGRFRETLHPSRGHVAGIWKSSCSDDPPSAPKPGAEHEDLCSTDGWCVPEPVFTCPLPGECFETTGN